MNVTTDIYGILPSLRINTYENLCLLYDNLLHEFLS